MSEESATGGAGAPVRSTAHPRRWAILVVLSATFMQLLDISIVGVAVASIQQNLTASYAQVQLVLVGYQVGFASMLILSARLGDIHGRRRLFLLGMALFTVASTGCGLAGSIEVLLIARVVQGVASALMFSQVLAVIQVLFDAEERGSALGAYGTTIGLGTVLGPVAGGALIQADLVGDAWRPIFLVNVPVGVAAFIAGVLLMPQSTAPNRPRLDVTGAVLSALGLGAVLYGLAEGRSRGWPGWLLATIAGGVVFLVVFAAHQRSLSRAGGDPILDTRLFADRAFRVGALLNVLFYAGVPGFFLIFSLYLQEGQGFSALGAGLAIFSYSIGAAITASAADGIAARIGNRVLQLAAAGLVAGMLAMIITVHLVGNQPHTYSWIPAMAISGLGFGLFVPPVIDIVLVNVDAARAGTASGALATAQQVGGAIGVAVLGTIFFALLDTTSSTTAPDGAPTAASATAFSDAFATALWFQVAIYVLVLLLVSRLPEANPRQLALLNGTGSDTGAPTPGGREP